MKERWSIPAAIGFGLCVAFAQVAAANAADVKVFTARAIATVLEKVGPEFERTTGHKLDVVSGFGPVFVRQINAGDPFDVFVSIPPTIDALFRDGKLLANSRTNLVRSGVGVAVRAGAPKPDISSVEAFKQALLNAKSVGYLPTAGVPQLVERLNRGRHQVESHGTGDRYRFRACRQGRARARGGGHDANSDHTRRRAGRAASAGNSVLHGVRRRHQRQFEGAGRGAGAAQISHGTRGHPGHQIAGYGTGLSAAQFERRRDGQALSALSP